MTLIDILQQYIRSELVIVIPVLCLLGNLLRKTRLKSNSIPYIILAVSLLITTFYTVSVCPITNWQQMCYVIFSILTQGILLAGSETFMCELLRNKTLPAGLVISPALPEQTDPLVSLSTKQEGENPPSSLA